MHTDRRLSEKMPLPLSQMYRNCIKIPLMCAAHVCSGIHPFSPTAASLTGWGYKRKRKRRKIKTVLTSCNQKMSIIFLEERQGIYLNVYKQQIWHHCNSCPLRKVNMLFFYDMIYKVCTAVNIIDPVYDLVRCFSVGLVGFHHMAPSG